MIIAACLRDGMLFMINANENMIPVATMICERNFEKSEAVAKADQAFREFASILETAALEAMINTNEKPN